MITLLKKKESEMSTGPKQEGITMIITAAIGVFTLLIIANMVMKGQW